jgi:hypothetical protein
MTDIGLGMKSNCLVTNGEDPYPTSESYILGALGGFLVDNFFGGIILVI